MAVLIPENFRELQAIHARIQEDRDKTPIEKGFVWSDLKTFRNYANGKTAHTITDGQKALLGTLVGLSFSDNVCHQIVSEAAGRITFTGWKTKNEAVKTWLEQFYEINNIGTRQGEIHYASLRDGNYVVAVDWDSNKERVAIYKEEWWDGSSGVYIHFDAHDNPDYAVKEWTYEKRINGQGLGARYTRRIIWYPDRVERWEAVAGSGPEGYQPAPLDSDIDIDGKEIWPFNRVDEEGDPLGIPYVHFPNAGKSYGNYGVSELDGGVIGFQDQLNLAQINITMTINLTGGQQYFATGVKLKKRDGTFDKIKAEPGMFHTSENENSKFGVLQAGDITKQIEGYTLKLKRVAQMTSTPLHSITGGDWPSGEALLRAELPAVNKARKQIAQYADCWKRVATLAMTIHNQYRDESEPVLDFDIEKGIIKSQFEDPEKRDAISRSVIVHNLTGVISIREGLRIQNYTDEEAQKIYEEMQEENKDAAQTQLTAISRGPLLGGDKSNPGGTPTKEKDARQSGQANNPTNDKK